MWISLACYNDQDHDTYIGFKDINENGLTSNDIAAVSSSYRGASQSCTLRGENGWVNNYGSPVMRD